MFYYLREMTKVNTVSNYFTRTISFSFACNTVLILNSAVILFHLMVLFQVIPADVVWAGRLKNREEVLVFEIISIAINAILIVATIAKKNAVAKGTRHRLINVVLWVFVIVFVLNTIGNMTALTTVETYIATPLTFILALCCARLAMEIWN